MCASGAGYMPQPSAPYTQQQPSAPFPVQQGLYSQNSGSYQQQGLTSQGSGPYQRQGLTSQGSGPYPQQGLYSQNSGQYHQPQSIGYDPYRSTSYSPSSTSQPAYSVQRFSSGPQQSGYGAPGSPASQLPGGYPAPLQSYPSFQQQQPGALPYPPAPSTLRGAKLIKAAPLQPSQYPLPGYPPPPPYPPPARMAGGVGAGGASFLAAQFGQSLSLGASEH